MAEPIGIAASVVTLVKTSRIVANGISKLLALKHAPDVLLALNNEVIDLEYLIFDIQDLEQRYQETLNDTIAPSFRRVLDRTREVLLNLQKLIAYRLTKYQITHRRMAVDRSSWLLAHSKIVAAHQDVHDCRLQLSTAILLLISSTSIQSYNRLHHSAINLDALISHNAQFGQTLSNHLCGMEAQLERLAGHITRPEEKTKSMMQKHTRPDPVRPHATNGGDLANDPALDQDTHNFPYVIIQTRILLQLYDVDDVNGKTALHWAVNFCAAEVSAFLVQSGADLAAEDKYGVQRPLLFDQARGSDDNSKYELLEEPALQALYRRLHNCETFQSILARASGFDLDETDMLGESLLFKAIRSDDIDLAFADVKTLDIFKMVKWVNEDIEDLINFPGRSCFHYTVRQVIEKRRVGERFPALDIYPDEDPEQVYDSFLSFLQKIIDDHYGFEGHETNSVHGRHTRRMVLTPRKDTQCYWDIVEKDTHVNRDISEVGSDNEAWEDAPEQPIGQQATL
ncbi:MAG: hypothetical protein Q9212_005094 [Teloschistes hypoglaucus]